MNISKKYSARLKRDVWGYDVRVNGRRVRDYRFDTKKDAEIASAKVTSEGVETDYGFSPKRKKTTLQDAFDMYKEKYEEQARLRNDYHYSSSLRTRLKVAHTFVEMFGATIPVSAVTEDHCMKWSNKLRETRTGETAAMYARTLAGMLTLAKQRSRDLINWKSPRISEYAPEDGGKRTRLVRPEEAKALVQQLLSPPPRDLHSGGTVINYLLRTRKWRDAADLFRLALATGGRKDELLRLSDTDLDRKSMLITLRATKGAHNGLTLNRRIPMAQIVIDLIDARVRDGLVTDGWVFPRRAESPFYSNHIHKAFHDAALAAGLVFGKTKEGGFTLHDARATYISHMLRRLSPSTVMMYSGHVTMVAFSKYLREIVEERETAQSVSQGLAGFM